MIPGETDEERCDKAISPFVYCVVSSNETQS